MNICSVPDCGQPHNAKGFCRPHYLADRLATLRAETPSKRMAGVPVEYEGPVTCRTCGTERPHTDFYVRGKRRRTDCRFCMTERARVSTERVEVADERWMTRRNGMLRRKYGITQAEFEALAAKQGGKCAICERSPRLSRANTRTGRTWTGLHVDHSHETGAVRSLLCIRCNTVVGALEVIGAGAFLSYLDVWDALTDSKSAG